jgi:methionyl aminopeptidase
VNEEIVHGFPSKDRILKEGDIVSIDMGVVFQASTGIPQGPFQWEL